MKHLRLRLPDELHARLCAELVGSRRSLNSEIVYRLELSLRQTDARSPAGKDTYRV